MITNLGGAFGVAPEICDETTSLKITRTGDGEVILVGGRGGGAVGAVLGAVVVSAL